MSKEFKTKAVQWVRAQMYAGKNIDEIIHALKSKGWSSDIIHEVIDEVKKPTFKKSERKTWPLVSVIIVIIALIGLACLWIFVLSYKNCSTQECFVLSANQCEKAKFKQSSAGNTFSYHSKDCVLTKKSIKLNESEPQEIKDFFEGKEMKCPYIQGQFDKQLIDTLSLGIENCEGELKDSIDELISAVSA